MHKITKQEIGCELNRLIEKQYEIEHISNWAHALYIQYQTEAGSNLDDVLLLLVTMGAGPEFELSYDRLKYIADRLIAGQDVEL